METTDLSSAAYWESDSVDLRLNPRRPVFTEGLRDFLERDLGRRAAVVLATSGSSGTAKFVVLPKAAILASARAVNAFCGLTREDVWLGGLSTFHVGGLGIFARAFSSGARVVPLAWDAWTRDGADFCGAVEKTCATLASLTPTHLCDLLRAERRCPDSLRGVFLGGGRIDPEVVARAGGLGWPLWPTYGMSETASQVATRLDGGCDWLPILPGWEVRTDARGRLQLRGESLFSGYVWREDETWHFDPARDAEGWFTNGDRCELRDGELRFLERTDGAVKISGELVSLPALNDRLAAFGIAGLVVAVPETRRGNELVLVGEEGDGDLLERFNADLPPLERIARHIVVAELPRTDLGKPDRARIEELAQSPTRFHPTG